MKFCMSGLLLLAMSAATIGCRGDVETTDDSHRIEVEVPKVEVGEEPVDLNVDTDEDVDIDTPAPGDE